MLTLAQIKPESSHSTANCLRACFEAALPERKLSALRLVRIEGAARNLQGDLGKIARVRVQGLCESRGGRPGLPVLMSLMVSVDVKQH